MKRFVFPAAVVALVLFLMFGSCSPEGGGTGIKRSYNVRDFNFGYYQEGDFMNELLALLMTKDGNRTFVAFISEEEINDVRSGKLDNYLSAGSRQRSDFITDSANFRPSNLEYSETPVILSVLPFPTDGTVYSVTCESLDPDILEVVDASDGYRYNNGIISGEVRTKNAREVCVLTHKLGLCRVVVTVKGLGFTQTKHFTLRVAATVEPVYVISNAIASRSNIGSRIWCFFKNVPEVAFPIVVSVKDSIEIYASAQYYDFHKYGRSPRTFLDTATVCVSEHRFIPYSFRLDLLNNLTAKFIKLQGIYYFFVFPPVIHQQYMGNGIWSPPTLSYFWNAPEFLHRSVSGERIVDTNILGINRVDTIGHDYPVYVDSVKLFTDIYCDNPYIDFSQSTFSFLSEFCTEFETALNVAKDSLTLSFVDIYSEVKKQNKGDYFYVNLMTHYTAHEQDSICNEIFRWKESLGLDQMQLSDDEASAAMTDEILRKANGYD